MWDTDKCMKVATAEVDAALAFVDFVAEQYLARATRHTRKPLPSQRPGVVLCWGAECTAEFGDLLHIAIPALLTGCVVVVKVPCCGGLSHIVTSTMFQNALPDSVLQYVVGTPEELGNRLLQTGKFDMLAMTGERSVADKLIHARPKPHRLKMHLDLAGDILAVITPEASDRSMVCREIAGLVLHGASKGPVKLVMAHRSIIQDVLRELAGALQELRLGADVACRRCRASPERAQELVIDALRKGAMVVNFEDSGGKLVPTLHGTEMHPAVVYPVNDTMRMWREDLSGNIIPVCSYTDASDVAARVNDAQTGLQVAVFDHTAHEGAVLRALNGQVRSDRLNRLMVNKLRETPPFDAQRCAELFDMFATARADDVTVTVSEEGAVGTWLSSGPSRLGSRRRERNTAGE
jgi:acyl-CoA reductase-like NAD-dependent aldehyde dehydrogenase